VETKESLDDLMVCSLGDDNAVPLDWTERVHWRLPQPLIGSGSVRYRDYVFLFGGGGYDGDSDEIYGLDLNRTECGWRRIESVRCPQRNRYTAILYVDGDDQSVDDDVSSDAVHLFTRGTPSEHYSIAMHELIDAMDIERMSKYGM